MFNAMSAQRLAYIIEHAGFAKLQQAERVCESIYARMSDDDSMRSVIIDLVNAADLMIRARSFDYNPARGSEYYKRCYDTARALCAKHR